MWCRVLMSSHACVVLRPESGDNNGKFINDYEGCHMSKVVHVSSYVRDVPATWEEHLSFHAYMKMYCGFNKEQSIAWAVAHLGPAPARVTVHKIEQIADEDDINEDE